ncbi:MAG: adenylyltransferase/cytidyltransferase family protein [Nanoarchaeota archaeon]
MTSLFIGRFQPPHAGHKALIETALKEGNFVIIAIRDTTISQENPYPYKERKRKLKEMFFDWRRRVKIIRLPNKDNELEVCYGRKVGYAFREVRLTWELEQISGTNIRAKL